MMAFYWQRTSPAKGSLNDKGICTARLFKAKVKTPLHLSRLMNGSQDFPDTVSPLKNEKQISEVKSAGEMANDGFEKAEIASSSELSDPEETDELEKEQTVASDAQDLHEVDVSEPMKQCSNCGARSTSVWRKGGPAADSLMCNGESLRFRLKLKIEY